jgi:hypothetical protein
MRAAPSALKNKNGQKRHDISKVIITLLAFFFNFVLNYVTYSPPLFPQL